VSLFQRRDAQAQLFGITGAGDLISRDRMGTGRTARVTNDTALRHSAVWACLRLRAGLISSFPVDCYRMVNGLQVEMPKPPIFTNPSGGRMKWWEWMWATQWDLDRAGNCLGLITERNGLGLPARIDLQPLAAWSVRDRDGVLTYRVGNKTYAADQVWHERAYPVAGSPVGLSPVAYAAWTIAEQESIHNFAMNWFAAGGRPTAHFKNTAKELQPKEAVGIKARYMATVQTGEPLVTGTDWEYTPINSSDNSMEWIESRGFSVAEIARFFDAPVDLIDGAPAGKSSVTYANITQRNLQLLVMALGPAVFRREQALFDLAPQQRFVKLNTDALLRMDPASRTAVLAERIASRQLAPSEARALENLPPFTSSQKQEFVDLFGQPGGSTAASPPASLPSDPNADPNTDPNSDPNSGGSV
jgi:HK97 family phage portal protein